MECESRLLYSVSYTLIDKGMPAPETAISKV